jgi:hypothetical protein
MKHSVYSPLHIELLAIKEGLIFLQALDINHVVVNSDCKIEVQVLISIDEDLSPLGNLIKDIKLMLSASPSISLFHAYRNSNYVAHRAHRLASHAWF